MTGSGLIPFWKLLSDAKFTGQPSKLSEDNIRRMASKLGWPEPQIEAAARGLREFLQQKE